MSGEMDVPLLSCPAVVTSPVVFPLGIMTINTLRARTRSHSLLYPAQRFLIKLCQRTESFYLKKGAKPTKSDLSSVYKSSTCSRNKTAKKLGNKEAAEHFWIIKTRPVAPRSLRGDQWPYRGRRAKASFSRRKLWLNLLGIMKHSVQVFSFSF